MCDSKYPMPFREEEWEVKYHVMQTGMDPFLLLDVMLMRIWAMNFRCRELNQK